jgi:hypothetical protein
LGLDAEVKQVVPTIDALGVGETFPKTLSCSAVSVSLSSKVVSLVFFTSTANLAVIEAARRLSKLLVTVAAVGASVGVTVTELELEGPKLPVANCEVPFAVTWFVTAASAGSPVFFAVKVHVYAEPAATVCGKLLQLVVSAVQAVAPLPPGQVAAMSP